MTELAVRPVAAPPVPAETATTVPPRRRRLLSLDVLRGLAIVGMLLVNDTGDKAATPPQLLHSSWHGLTLADLVFPLFLFAVGVAMPFSTRAHRPRAVLRRVVLLVVIGSLLVSAKYRHLGLSTGVLQHIAGAYLLAWLALHLPRRWQPVAALAGLGVTWAAYAFLGPNPGSWGQTDSFGVWLDTATLGHFSAEGLHTLLPSAVSVLGGVFVGRMVHERHDTAAVRRVLGFAGATLVAGLLLGPVVPVNKHLWTPSYVLVTTGLSALLFVLALEVVDRQGLHGVTRPLRVMGANAIAVYAATSLVFVAALQNAKVHAVRPLQDLGGPEFGAVAWAVLSLLAAWALCEWMWRRRWFLRV